MRNISISNGYDKQLQVVTCCIPCDHTAEKMIQSFTTKQMALEPGKGITMDVTKQLEMFAHTHISCGFQSD